MAHEPESIRSHEPAREVPHKNHDGKQEATTTSSKSLHEQEGMTWQFKLIIAVIVASMLMVVLKGIGLF